MTSCAIKNPSPQEINALLALFNAKRYPEAAAAAQKLTQRFPAHGLGWNVLGLALIFMGRTADALRPLEKAAMLVPNDASIRSNFGNVLRDLGRLSEAEINYKTALTIDPRYIPAQTNLGALLMEMGRLDEAETCYRTALQLNPAQASAHRDLGNVLRRMGRLPEARTCYEAALDIEPNSAKTYGDMGIVLQLDGQTEAAIEHYRMALKFDPNSVATHNDLGVALLKTGQWAECAAHCQAAIRINPRLYQPHINLGNALKEMGHLAEAEASYRNALKIEPNFAEAHSSLGSVLQNQSKLAEAEASCRAALKINPHYTEAYINLGNVLKDSGRLDEAEASYRKVLHLDPYHPNAFSNLLFSLNYRETTPQHSHKLARQFGLETSFKTQKQFTNWSTEASPVRLRIGFVSGDLRNHPVGYFLESWLKQITQNAFELHAYTTKNQADELTQRIQPYFSGWHSLQGLDDETAARRIHADGIHVLIDLSGHTAGNRLPVFAFKPAPVQASWLGYFATTGLAEMDYLIADPLTLPESEAIYFTENIWRLPETRLCFTPPEVDLDVSPLPALANGYITFGCFNNLTKMNDAVVALWAHVLKAVPESRLFLKSRQLNETTKVQHTLKRFAKHGIAADHLILEGASPRAEYLAAYHRVDIALDPFPFTGGTTTAEGLWMGVPVLTLAGERFLSRQGIGMLMNAGLTDWIAADTDDYVTQAAAHANDLPRLARLREGLRQQVLVSPLFDAARFARHFEACLQGMWQQYHDRQPAPAKNTVEYKIDKTRKNRVLIVSASQRTEADFWENSALGRSLPHHLHHDARLIPQIAFVNRRGLSDIFNEAIDQAEDEDILVFMHDDVWIDEIEAFADIIMDGLAEFDVLGVAGNRRRVPNQPAWGFIDSKLTPDKPANLSGRIAHGKEPFGEVAYFGETPIVCELLDGVFLATQKNRLNKKNVRFDPQLDFHLYDLDFCRSARKAGLKLGTWLIKLTHQSPGNYRSTHWREKSQLYLKKWEKR
ncbi:MAG: tetratricopeptide repeat protein [Halothiobacillus sp.]